LSQSPRDSTPLPYTTLFRSRPRDGPGEELGLTVTPGFLAVGLKEVREARREVARDVPHERGDGVAGGTARPGQLLIAELLDRPFTERLVSPVFALDRS